MTAHASRSDPPPQKKKIKIKKIIKSFKQRGRILWQNVSLPSSTQFLTHFIQQPTLCLSPFVLLSVCPRLCYSLFVPVCVTLCLSPFVLLSVCPSLCYSLFVPDCVTLCSSPFVLLSVCPRLCFSLPVPVCLHLKICPLGLSEVCSMSGGIANRNTESKATINVIIYWGPDFLGLSIFMVQLYQGCELPCQANIVTTIISFVIPILKTKGPVGVYETFGGLLSICYVSIKPM
jgi:hypothetical protein